LIFFFFFFFFFFFYGATARKNKNEERYPVAQLCVNTLPATKVTLITDGI
jgi:hypothetical protein